jgi:hypothetical protein
MRLSAPRGEVEGSAWNSTLPPAPLGGLCCSITGGSDSGCAECGCTPVNCCVAASLSDGDVSGDALANSPPLASALPLLLLLGTGEAATLGGWLRGWLSAAADGGSGGDDGCGWDMPIVPLSLH